MKRFLVLKTDDKYSKRVALRGSFSEFH